MQVPLHLRDIDCTADTPVELGKAAQPVYGKGVRIRPRIHGRKDTAANREIYLPELLPLEEYDRIIVLFSGGKDSAACFFKLLELGVPVEKIELFHHDIDGGNPRRRMDWPVTGEYVRAFADTYGVKLRPSWRVGGFFYEMRHIGASLPVAYIQGDRVEYAKTTEVQRRTIRLLSRGNLTKEEREELLGYGYRCKFPAKGSIRNGRWCSSLLKCMVADAVIRSLPEYDTDCKLLIVSGERRGESAGRSRYNEMELHGTNAAVKKKRLVHQWRMVIDHHEGDIWAVLKRHELSPHPCYICGWNRCSCAMCIFSLPRHWAGIRELFPENYAALCQDEKDMGFTLDNKCCLEDFVGDADSCVCHESPQTLQLLRTGEYTAADIWTPWSSWKLPAGAFHGATGGPC